MKLDKTVNLTIDGKQYKLLYNIKALMSLENVISTKNVSKMVQNFPFSHTDIVVCLFVGLQEHHPEITQKKVMKLLEKWLEKDSLVNLNNLIMLALAKGGAIGFTDTHCSEPVKEADKETEEKK